MSLTTRSRASTRTVPTSLRIKALFGANGCQACWFAFAFASLFFWGTGIDLYLTTRLTMNGTLAQTSGQVTSWTSGRSSHLRRSPHRPLGPRVYQVRYTYYADGRQLTGVSATHQPSGSYSQVVEYVPGRPHISRIAGMSREPLSHPAQVGVVLLFFLGLCGGVMHTLRKGAAIDRLLATGMPARGKLVSKTEVKSPQLRKRRRESNYRMGWDLTFEFPAVDGRIYTAVVRADNPNLLQDEEAEPLLYNTADPSKALLLDQLPGSPRLTSLGEISDPSPALAPLLLLLPSAVVLATAALIWYRILAP